MLNYNDPTIIKWEVDEFGNKISVEITNETKQIVGNKLVLEGMPDEYYRVQIAGFAEIDINSQITTTTQFKVDYRKTGIIYFHPDLDGTTITIDKYYSRGLVYFPASRIWTKIEGADISETLNEVIDEAETAIAIVNQLDGYVENAELELDNHTLLKQTQLDDYTTTKETQLDSYTATKETQLNNHTDTKETQLNNYTDNKETQLSNYTDTKQIQLNNYTTTKQTQLDNYTITKQTQLENYTTTKQTQLDDYTDDKELELDSHVLLKQTQLDDYTTTKETQLDSYTATKETQLNNYTDNKETQLNNYTDTKQTQLNNYTTTKQTQLDNYTTTKQTQLDNYTDGKELEINNAADLKLSDINTALVNAPYVGANNNWYIWDFDLEQYVDSEVYAIGPQGEQGYSIQYDWDGTSLGIKTTNESIYSYTNLKGEKGDIGEGLKILGSLNNTSELPLVAEIGDAYLINQELWVWEGSQFINAGTIQGPAGVSLQYDWNGTELGIKTDVESSFTYVDLLGPQGIQGNTGVSLQYNWNGTQLGIKREDEGVYTYTDLIGPQGEQGPRGEQGVQGEQGPQGEQGEQGVQGYSLQYNWNGTELGVKTENEIEYVYADLQGEGFYFKDTWSEITTYNINDVVEFSNMIFLSLQNNNLNHTPDITQNTVYWSRMVQGASAVKRNHNIVWLESNQSSINFIGGTIDGLGVNDQLDVFMNSVKLTEGVDYEVNVNRTQIDKLTGSWEGSIALPTLVEFISLHNIPLGAIQVLDGANLIDESITADKLDSSILTNLTYVGTSAPDPSQYAIWIDTN